MALKDSLLFPFTWLRLALSTLQSRDELVSPQTTSACPFQQVFVGCLPHGDVRRIQESWDNRAKQQECDADVLWNRTNKIYSYKPYIQLT